MLKTVLVALDGSTLSEQALAYARDLVCAGGRVVLLSVVDVPDASMYSFYPVPVVVQDRDHDRAVHELTDQAVTYLEALAAQLRVQGIEVACQVEVGEPANAIVEKAKVEQADAIIMCTHGRSGLSKWLFGSVTQKVLGVMPCPVLVVPGKPQSDE
jgi:nucleotide-binding universal stress UspA family protein